MGTYLNQKAEVLHYPHNVTDRPVVSICIVTYQHENYIKECINGILKQETDFAFEILLGEDDSKDNTREICIDYSKKNPDKIRLFLHNRRNVIYIGGRPTGRFNFLYNLHQSKGKYIAICEGDDYWTDPYKLQKQVDFLEANPDYVMCSHNGTILDEIGTEKTGKKFINTEKDFDYGTKDLLNKNQAATLTVMLRNGLIKEFPEWYITFPGGDRSLYLILSQYGKLRHLEFNGAVYRLNKTGASSKIQSVNLNTRLQAKLEKCITQIRFQSLMDEFFNFKYSSEIKKNLQEIYWQAMNLAYYNRKVDLAQKMSKKINLNDRKIKQVMKVLLIRFFPRFLIKKT